MLSALCLKHLCRCAKKKKKALLRIDMSVSGYKFMSIIVVLLLTSFGFQRPFLDTRNGSVNYMPHPLAGTGTLCPAIFFFFLRQSATEPLSRNGVLYKVRNEQTVGGREACSWRAGLPLRQHEFYLKLGINRSRLPQPHSIIWLRDRLSQVSSSLFDTSFRHSGSPPGRIWSSVRLSERAVTGWVFPDDIPSCNMVQEAVKAVTRRQQRYHLCAKSGDVKKKGGRRQKRRDRWEESTALTFMQIRLFFVVEKETQCLLSSKNNVLVATLYTWASLARSRSFLNRGKVLYNTFSFFLFTAALTPQGRRHLT